MSNEAGGSGAGGPQPGSYPPPASYPPQAAYPPQAYAGPVGAPYYPPPNYAAPGYPRPNYAPPGYPPPGYGPPGHPPPGYPGYAPFGYAGPPVLKPGIIPLRPLTLSDIFNGAVAYVRTNPKATLGITAIVVIVSQVLALILQLVPLATLGALDPSMFDTTSSAAESDISDGAAIALFTSTLVGAITTGTAALVLSGILTVVIGRAVFGATITPGEAWRRFRCRLLPLFGVTLIQLFGAALLFSLPFGIGIGLGLLLGGVAGFVIGALLFVTIFVLVVYLGTSLMFAPTLVVLERMPVFAAMTRSFALVKNDFWRLLGIWLLAMLIASLVAGAVGFPFSLAGQLMLSLGETVTMVVLAFVLIAIGGAIGQIITAPFSAGVVVLLYTDRRIRAEAFDLVLQTGLPGPIADAGTSSTDDLWLRS